MKELLEYIVKQLVTKPEAVLVDEQKVNGEVSLLLTVDPSDMGLIIGKNGQTIKALRRLLTVRAMAENVRVNLQLNEVGEPARSEDEKNQSISKEANEDSEPAEQTDDK